MSIDVSNFISQLTGNFSSSIGSSNIKTTNSYSKSNQSFDDFMSKVNNQSSNSNKVESQNNDENDDKFKEVKSNDSINSDVNKVNDDESSNSNASNDDKKIKLSNETREALKNLGVSDEEIDNVKSLDDLKNLVEKKLLDSNNLEKLLRGDLLNNSAMDKLIMLLMSSFNQTNIQNVSDNIVSNLKNQINDLIKSLSGQNSNEKVTQLLDNFKDNVQKLIQANCSNTNDPAFKLLVTKNVESQILNLISGSMDQSKFNVILPKVKQELTSLLNDVAKDIKNQKLNNSDVLNNLVNLLKQDQSLDKAVAETYSSSDNLDSNNSSSNKDENLTSNQSSKDSSFLSSLTSKDDKSNSISKVTNFMTQFNNTVNSLDTAGNGENIVIDKTNLNNDIIKTLKYMESNDVKNLTVKINPKELGEVTIKLTMEAGQMKASITANNKDAYNLLNSNILDITNKLQNNDIKIQNISLSIYEDTTFFKDGSNNQENNGQGQNKEQKHSTDKVNGSSNDNTLDNLGTVQSNVNMLA